MSAANLVFSSKSPKLLLTVAKAGVAPAISSKANGNSCAISLTCCNANAPPSASPTTFLSTTPMSCIFLAAPTLAPTCLNAAATPTAAAANGANLAANPIIDPFATPALPPKLFICLWAPANCPLNFLVSRVSVTSIFLAIRILS